MRDWVSELQAPVAEIAPGVFHLRRRVDSAPLLAEIQTITADSPLRHLKTRTGTMSVALTNCGTYGWHSDAKGYRYELFDPLTEQPWPNIPKAFHVLATTVAAEVGFKGFNPDCCLINQYAIGAKMGAHRDFDEKDYRWPIVSVSLGLTAQFVWYGESKTSKAQVIEVNDGDVVVFGGVARKGYHAVRTIRAPKMASNFTCRYNLTFRKAG